MTYYDDNFGNWESSGDREDDAWFQRYCRKNSVKKTCSICGRKVKLLPQYDKCDSCCRKIEAGMDTGY
jgi:hypothetical protein